MRTFVPIIVAAAALVDEEACVLLQQRPPDKPMAGLWEFPGGKLERGEAPEAALVRELEEELGIEVDAADLVPATFASAAVEGVPLLLLLYLCRQWKGCPEPLHASALRWVSPGRMLELPMPPADRPLIPILEALIQAAPSR